MQRDFSGNIDVWLSKGTRDSWRRNENGTISVIGNMYINDPSIKKFPVKFLCINGKLKCNCPCLISVEGAPVTYKELDFYNCFFPAFFYLKDILDYLLQSDKDYYIF